MYYLGARLVAPGGYATGGSAAAALLGNAGLLVAGGVMDVGRPAGRGTAIRGAPIYTSPKALDSHFRSCCGRLHAATAARLVCALTIAQSCLGVLCVVALGAVSLSVSALTGLQLAACLAGVLCSALGFNALAAGRPGLLAPAVAFHFAMVAGVCCCAGAYYLCEVGAFDGLPPRHALAAAARFRRERLCFGQRRASYGDDRVRLRAPIDKVTDAPPPSGADWQRGHIEPSSSSAQPATADRKEFDAGCLPVDIAFLLSLLVCAGAQLYAAVVMLTAYRYLVAVKDCCSRTFAADEAVFA